MARFGEQMRTILADVAQFLHKTLKAVDLPPSARLHRTSLIGRLDNLQSEYPQLTWELNENDADDSLYSTLPCNDQHLECTKPSSSIVSDDHASDIVVAAGDIHFPAISGYLAKKPVIKNLCKKKKVWCVVKDGIFYEFEKPTSSSQTRSFPLRGLQVQAKSVQKNEFELIGANQKNMFITTDVGEMGLWLSALNAQIHVIPDPRKSIIYESADVDTDPDQGQGESTENTNRQTSNATTPARPLVNAATHANLQQRNGEIRREASPNGIVQSQTTTVPDGPNKVPAEDEVMYEVVPTMTVSRIQFRNEGSTISSTGTMNRADKAAGAVHGAAIVAETTSTEQPFPPRKRQSRPGLPVPRPTRSSFHETGILTNSASDEVYVALWDCSADAANELSFKAGDSILIVSREYEELGWWVGELVGLHDTRPSSGLIGLVPKEYLRGVKNS